MTCRWRSRRALQFQALPYEIDQHTNGQILVRIGRMTIITQTLGERVIIELQPEYPFDSELDVENIDGFSAQVAEKSRIHGDSFGTHPKRVHKDDRKFGENLSVVHLLSESRRAIKQAFWPPKPKELDITVFNRLSRAWLGT